MSITLDDKAVNVFKLYDEMTIAYSKDIDVYETLLKAIEAMIAQKEETLQDIKDKTVALLNSSLEITTTQKTPVRKKRKKFNYAGVVDLPTEKEIESSDAVIEISHSMTEEEQSQVLTPPVNVQKPEPALNKKIIGKGKYKGAAKPKKLSKRSEKIAKAKPIKGITDLKCLYHPESPASDKGRQLCKSCKWKLIYSGLKNYDKDPAVILYLKGETTKIPDLGQSTCPIHPTVPSYNQKTGLCKACQKKAKEIGVEDRHLTKKELTALRNASL